MYRDTSSYFLLRSGDYKKTSLQTTKSHPETINDIAYPGRADCRPGIVGLALQRVPAARRVRGFLDVPAAVTPRSI